jgi:hypothetical protein
MKANVQITSNEPQFPWGWDDIRAHSPAVYAVENNDKLRVVVLKDYMDKPSIWAFSQVTGEVRVADHDAFKNSRFKVVEETMSVKFEGRRG